MKRLRKNLAFETVWTDDAIEDLSRLEHFVSKRIIKKVDELTTTLFSQDIKRLTGMPYYRLRVGDYRIIFAIEDNKIIILHAEHRKKVYKNF